MILLAAIVAGLAAGLARAGWKRRSYQPYLIKHAWLVLVAFIPQWILFVFPATRSTIPADWAPVALVGSQIILLIFAWLNITQSGFWFLGFGLALNLAVIVLNGGLMPVSPETAAWLTPDISRDMWHIGARFGFGKDIVLPLANTRLWFLSDMFRTPAWLNYRVAFSIGDCLIALGTFWALWALGGPSNKNLEV